MKLSVFTLIMFIFLGAHSQEISESAELMDEEGSSVTVTRDVAGKVDFNDIRTKEDILRYLNSLSAKDLIDLHEARERINEELRTVMGLSGATLLSGLLGWTLTGQALDDQPTRSQRFRRVPVTLTVGLSGLALVWFAFFEKEGLGLERPSFDFDSASSDPYRWGDKTHKQARHYINSLTLEEAKELLADLKEINEARTIDLRE